MSSAQDLQAQVALQRVYWHAENGVPAQTHEYLARLQDLQAQVALQRVALPLHESEARTRGLAALPGLLWAEDGSPVESFPRLNMNRAAFIDELCEHATPAEMVGAPDTILPSMSAHARWRSITKEVLPCSVFLQRFSWCSEAQ